MKLNRQNIYFLIVLCGICGASIPSFAKIALESMSSGIMTLIRYGITFLFLLIFFGMRRKFDWRKIWQSLPVSSLIALNVIFFSLAIKYISAATSPLLYNVVPLMVAIISWYYLKTHLSRARIAGLFIGFSGVALVALAPIVEKSATLDFKPLGVFLVFLGSLTFSLYTVLAKPLQDKMSPFEMLMGGSIMALLIQSIYMLATSQSFAYSDISQRSFLAAVETATIGTIVFYGLYQYLIKVSGPVSAALMVYVQPAAGAIWSLALLGDRLSGLAILGGIISLVGIAQVNGYWSQLKRKII